MNAHRIFKGLRETEGGVVFRAKIGAGSSRSRIVGVLGEEVKISVAAAPEKGKANKAVVEFLAKTFGVAKSEVEVIAGEHNPHKEILMRGVSAGEFEEMLGRLIKG